MVYTIFTSVWPPWYTWSLWVCVNFQAGLHMLWILSMFQWSLTSFVCLGRCLYIGQPHIFRLILDEQQADEGECHTGYSGRWQYRPPAVSLGQNRGYNGAKAPGQIHAAWQNCPPCPKLRGLKPLQGGVVGWGWGRERHEIAGADIRYYLYSIYSGEIWVLNFSLAFDKQGDWNEPLSCFWPECFCIEQCDRLQITAALLHKIMKRY